MATSGWNQTAAIVVPAEYLEDFRTAVVAEIECESGALTTNQAGLVEGPESYIDIRQADRDGSAASLRTRMQMLDQVLDATERTRVTANTTAAFHTLEEMVKLLKDRLAGECGYGPLDMLAVLELTERLRWAASEAARIRPEVAAAA